MKDDECFLNETYYLELTANGSPVEPRLFFRKVNPPYPVKFPYPKDTAIRRFMQRKRAELKDGETLELWRDTPSLVCCIRATNKSVQVMPD